MYKYPHSLFVYDHMFQCLPPVYLYIRSHDQPRHDLQRRSFKVCVRTSRAVPMSPVEVYDTGGAVALALIGPSTPGCDRERIALPKSHPPVICIQIGQLGSPQPRQAHVTTRWEKLLAENTTPGTCFHVFRGGNVCPCTLLSLEWYGLCNWYVISLFLQPVFFFFFLTVFCCASFNHR